MTTPAVVFLASLALLVACGDDSASVDGGSDASVDAAMDVSSMDGSMDGSMGDGSIDAGPECSNAADCDDGLFCNGLETCDGTCVAGTPPTLDDGVECTIDECDESADVVVHTPSDTLCDDGLFCNGAETCSDVDGCGVGTPPVVDDGIACTDDTCDEDRDMVVNSPNAGACDDGDDCTDDVCTAGVGCSHPFVCECAMASDCDDGNACTDDACSAGTCTYVNNTSPCDDGLFCNGADVCSAGACVHDGDPCVGGAVCAVTCNEAVDSCFASAGTTCTSDGNPCTDDVCDGDGACTHPNNTSPCSDGLFCNGVDTCTGGACVRSGDPCAGGAECNDTCDEDVDSCAVVAGASCSDDGNVCTDDVCDGSGACTHPNNTAPCDDGSFCNGADVCAGGSCTHAGDPCVGGTECNDTCDEADDDCFVAAGIACVDTTPDDCSLAACDGVGACDQSHDPAASGSSCDDGMYCNGADMCNASGGCTMHAGDPCAPDMCNATVGACPADIHRIFMSTGTAPIGSGDSVAFQLASNAFCQSAATAAGLTGTWLGVYSTGFVRTGAGVPLTLRGPVVNFDGDVVFPDRDAMYANTFSAPITTDENGDPLPGGATAWTSQCFFDFLAGRDVAAYGDAMDLEAMRVTCSTDARRRICISD